MGGLSFLISPSSETREAEQRLLSLCHLKKHLKHNFKFELFIEIKLCEHFQISKRIYLQTKSETKLMSGTVIKFHYVHVLSKTVSSQMQHLQHNFKVNY